MRKEENLAESENFKRKFRFYAAKYYVRNVNIEKKNSSQQRYDIVDKRRLIS